MSPAGNSMDDPRARLTNFYQIVSYGDEKYQYQAKQS